MNISTNIKTLISITETISAPDAYDKVKVLYRDSIRHDQRNP